MRFCVYILHSKSGDIYHVGHTHNVTDRIKRHNDGTEKFTSPYRPWEIRCVIEKETRSQEMILEKKLKNLNRTKLVTFTKNTP